MESFIRTQISVTLVLLLKKFHDFFPFHFVDVLVVSDFVRII